MLETVDKPARPVWKKVLLTLFLTGVFSYLGVVILFLFVENMLLFHPVSARKAWVEPPTSAIQDVYFNTADGTRIHGWWLPVQGANGALLFSHGNAGNLSYRGTAIQTLAQELGESVLIYDYPGYGKSGGRPSEPSCYAAGDAAYDWLTREAGVQPENILLYGKSLGGGVATELATRRPHRALILVKVFTSVPALGQELYPFLPVRRLARNQFDNLAKIGSCPRPVFIAHGDCDSLTGLHHAEQLYAAAPSPKRLLVMPGCDHNDPVTFEFMAALRDFLQEHAPPRVGEAAAVRPN